MSRIARRAFWWPAMVLASTACVVGQKASSFAPAQTAAGVTVDIVRMKGYLHIGGAELLAVQDTALLLVHNHRLLLAPLRDVWSAKVRQIGTMVSEGRIVSPSVRYRANTASRYPQGVGPDLLTALLAAYQQTALDVLPR